MDMTHPAPARLPNRFGRGAILVGLFGVAGPAIGVLVFVVYGSIYLTFFSASASSSSYPGQGVVAMIMFSPFFIIGAYLTAWMPAAATGGLFATELVARGRVSWVTAFVAPLVCIYVYKQIFPGMLKEQEHYLAGFVASLSIRFFFRGMMNGSEKLAPVRVEAGAVGRLVAVALGWRARVLLVLALAVPALAGLGFWWVYPQSATPFVSVELDTAVATSCVLTLVSGAVLLCIVRRARGVRLLDAAWACGPVWAGMLLLSGGYAAEELAVLAALSIAAFLGVAWAGRRWLDWGPQP